MDLLAFFDPRSWDRQFILKRRREITITKCLTSQKSAELVYLTAEDSKGTYNCIFNLAVLGDRYDK